MKSQEITVNQTHRGLKFVDGVFAGILDPGRYEVKRGRDWLGRKRPEISIVLVDLRERELNIKGQEILTADKVAIRVNIVVQFRVTDPKAAVLEVAEYENRLYSDVQLAARRSLASMRLEEILTNRNRLSEDILADVKDVALKYGVNIVRADVKDLVFPGNLQEVMNKVLTAERLSQAQLIEARTRAEMASIDTRSRAEAEERSAEATANAIRMQAEAANAFANNPALLRLRELDAMQALAQSANARLYIDFQKKGINPPND
jgi:regulator of protease activity HflC (stomatin/prohibitin superfamily)